MDDQPPSSTDLTLADESTAKEDLPEGSALQAQALQFQDFGGVDTTRDMDRDSFELRIEYGHAELSSRKIDQARDGSVLVLAEDDYAEARLVLAGRTIAVGDIVTIEGKVGLRIKRLLGSNNDWILAGRNS